MYKSVKEAEYRILEYRYKVIRTLLFVCSIKKLSFL